MAPRTKPPAKKSAKKKAASRKKVVKKPVATVKVARVRKATGAHSVASPVAPGIPITPNENDYNRMPGLPYLVKDDGQYQGVKMWEKVSLLDTPQPPWYRKFWNWLKKNW